MKSISSWTTASLSGLLYLVIFAATFFSDVTDTSAQEGSASMGFNGSRTDWHGFDRYDFMMDEQTLDIEPCAPPAGEGTGVQAPPPGKRRCIVVVPKQPAPGNPWSWRGCYWDFAPQTEINLLNRGFYVTFVSPDPGKPWDAWYAFLTGKHGFSPKPAFVGMSKGGVNAYAWATRNPDKVSCIYADNPALYPQDFANVGELAKNDVPLLHLCGSLDYLFYHHTLPVENLYHQLGGRITVMVKDGSPHHPHSLNDPKIVSDWIVQNTQPDSSTPFTLPGLTLIKSHYYSFENTYSFFPKESMYITCRGPLFTDCYDRYDAKFGDDWQLTGVTVIVPKTPAPGNPWVYRGDRINRAEPSAVDLGLLAKGFYIVAAPLDLGAGPDQKEWDATYKLLTDNGFSKKPALEGAGTGAGEAYAWAITNPDKVSCIYAENPLLHSIMFPHLAPIDNLDALARAQIPILHVCGALDPLLADNSDKVEQQYKQLGGQITVIKKVGVGHYPLGPIDPQPVIDFIAQNGAK
jgi:pimeloyl-ACP methyl ester carboxylesterase